MAENMDKNDFDELDFDFEMLFSVNIDNPVPDAETSKRSGAKSTKVPSSYTSKVTSSPPEKKRRVGGKEENQDGRNTINCPSVKKTHPISIPTSSKQPWYNDFKATTSSIKSREKLQTSSTLQLSSVETERVEKMTHAEKARMADCVASLFFGEQSPTSALMDYNQKLPNWDILFDPFSYEEPIYLKIDGILYYVNYVKLKNKNRTTYFKFLDGATAEAIKYSDLILEFGKDILYFRTHTEITICRKLEWVLHKTLPDSSSLYLVCRRNELLFYEK